jgi:hypothetical protein
MVAQLVMQNGPIIQPGNGMAVNQMIITTAILVKIARISQMLMVFGMICPAVVHYMESLNLINEF